MNKNKKSFRANLPDELIWKKPLGEVEVDIHNMYRVSGHNGTVFDGNFPSLREWWVKFGAM